MGPVVFCGLANGVLGLGWNKDGEGLVARMY